MKLCQRCYATCDTWNIFGAKLQVGHIDWSYTLCSDCLTLLENAILAVLKPQTTSSPYSIYSTNSGCTCGLSGTLTTVCALHGSNP